MNHVWELQPTCIMKLAKIAPHFNTTTKHWPASTCASAPWPPRCAPSGWWAGRPWCRSAGPTRSRAAATPDWGCGSPPSVPVCGMSWIDATRRGGDSKRGQTPKAYFTFASKNSRVLFYRSFTQGYNLLDSHITFDQQIPGLLTDTSNSSVKVKNL